MHRRTKLWSSLSLAALVGGGAASGYAEQDSAGHPAAAPAFDHASQVAMAPGGEGAGAEGEGLAAAIDPATNDVAYLSQLGLMRGHLLVGLQLYRAGHVDHARTHMKHPKSELYADLVPAFESRGAKGFGDQLTTLSSAVESDGSDRKAVEAAYANVLEGISEAESHVTATDPASRLKVVVSLMRTAAEEYAIGVVDGKVVNGHEYQDAFGFTQTAETMVDNIEAGDNAELAAALKDIDGHIQALYDAGTWPDVMPPATVEADASQLYGAAARVEITALSVR